MKYYTKFKEIQLISHCNNMTVTLSTNIFVHLILRNNIRNTYPNPKCGVGHNLTSVIPLNYIFSLCTYFGKEFSLY